PFRVIGLMGMRLIVLDEAVGGLAELKWLYFIFYLGVFLTGIGSSYYHYHPDNQTLVWDRLPMTISFMAFFCIVVGEYMSPEWGLNLSVPLLAVGLFSVIYWRLTESAGQGDLRLYGLIQFLPIVLIPFILAFYSPAQNGSRYIWGMIAVYAVSKIMEFFDAGIYEAAGLISGHSLKHLFAAAGPLILYWPLRYRKGGFGAC
ncbi:MAG: ceramidase domain-containing protein, partial [Gammaproteobacteria bacterium]